MSTLRLSIVVPSFNQARFLRQTLESLVGQASLRPGEMEILVIDGGSTDGSVDIIREHAGRIAYWVSERDRGQTHALVKGFSAATGDVLGWLCSDDLFEPYTAREVLDFFSEHLEADFVYGDGCWIDERGNRIRMKKEIEFDWFIWLYDHNYIPQPSCFWRRPLYEMLGGLDERFECAMDGDLWARFAQVTQPHHVRRMWSRMRRYAEQKNQRLRSKSNNEDSIIRERVTGHLHSKASLWMCHRAAKSVRVARKLAAGCYW